MTWKRVRNNFDNLLVFLSVFSAITPALLYLRTIYVLVKDEQKADAR